MSSLWINAGALVLDGTGAAVLCSRCPCGDGPPTSPPVRVPCCPDDDIPGTLYLTISGGGCVDGTHRLVYTADGSPWGASFAGLWVSDAEGACTGGFYIFDFGCGVGGFWHVTIHTTLASGNYNPGFDLRASTAGAVATCSPFDITIPGATWSDSTHCNNCDPTHPFDYTVTP